MSERQRHLQRNSALALIAALLLTSCVSEADQDRSSPPPVAAQELDCEREGYPCTMDEVDPAVYEREATYMDHISSILAGGTFADALAWAREQEGVVAAEADDSTLGLRLEGGRPLLVIQSLVEDDDVADVGMRLASVVKPPGDPSTEPLPHSDVVGRDTERDNPQNRKKALFLEPYHWEQGQHFDEGMAELRLIPDYGHDVDDVMHLKDRQVTPAVFATWRNYDAIFAHTHGGNIGQWRWIASGIHRPVEARGPNRGELCREHFQAYATPTAIGVDCNFLYLGGAPESGGQLSLILGVSTEFFQTVYRPTATHAFYGLQKAIVYLGGCSVLHANDMATAVAGSSSAVLAWDKQTRAGAGDLELNSERAAKGLLRALVDLSLPVGRAYDALVAAGLTYEQTFDSTLRLHDNGPESKKLRLYDLETLRDPEVPTKIIENGAELRIIGTPGDGVNDHLEIAVEIIGVIDPDDTRLPPDPAPGGTPTPMPSGFPMGRGAIILASSHGSESPASLYDLHFYISDELIGSDNLGNTRLPSAEVIPLDDTTYRYTFTAPLPFDVDPDGTDATLKVVVDLPEGGISDYEVDVTLVGRSYAVITVGSQTWEFEPSEFWQCYVNEDSLAAGDINADGSEFSAILRADGAGSLVVSGGSPRERWSAEAERDQTTMLHLLPAGSSQIDTIIIENGRAWGQATFIDINAAFEAWSNNHASPDWPASVPGTFDILCGG